MIDRQEANTNRERSLLTHFLGHQESIFYALFGQRPVWLCGMGRPMDFLQPINGDVSVELSRVQTLVAEVQMVYGLVLGGRVNDPASDDVVGCLPVLL